ncbi:MAG: ABC transporter ATP-binding protein [Anaerolineales bacterium]|nr:ABC transporter ATP-binding protein [Anaerolineales bacterium]
MSSEEIAIKVEHLSKMFQMYSHPQDRLKQFVVPRFQRLIGKPPKTYFREFWAMHDVSFEVKKGETVGIIGRNGSGKSTLLQLICGTLTPTWGSVQTHGRVAALLELGSGFNPEFTGRENVYLNGSVLGLSTQEIEARFDDIAAFADIGEFIEQPVKTYSSGMMVRLAFAVIAHVDADILVVDEALSVGDAVFVQRCMRFIRGFQENGTLLFVSHDVGTVVNLCRSAIWLHQGQVRETGETKTVAEAYLQYTQQEIYGEKIQLSTIKKAGRTPLEKQAAGREPLINYSVKAEVVNNLEEASGWKTDSAEIIDVRLEHVEEGIPAVFQGGESVRMIIRARAHQELDQPIIGFLVRDRLGQDLFGENTLQYTDLSPVRVGAGAEFSAEFVFFLPMLPNGNYAVMASVANGSLFTHIQHHWLHDALIINVVSSKVRWGLVGIPFDEVILRVDG